MKRIWLPMLTVIPHKFLYRLKVYLKFLTLTKAKAFNLSRIRNIHVLFLIIFNYMDNIFMITVHSACVYWYWWVSFLKLAFQALLSCVVFNWINIYFRFRRNVFWSCITFRFFPNTTGIPIPVEYELDKLVAIY